MKINFKRNTITDKNGVNRSLLRVEILIVALLVIAIGTVCALMESSETKVVEEDKIQHTAEAAPIKYTIITNDSVMDINEDGAQNPNEVEYRVYSFIRKHGYSHEATVGIMGNIWQESRMDSDSSNGVAYGLFHIEGGRLENYKNFANNNEFGISDGYAQIEFMNKEMHSEDMKLRMRGEVSPQNLIENEVGPMRDINEFKNTKDVEKAVRIFQAVYERAGTPAIDKRIEAAKRYDRMFSHQNVKTVP